MKPECSRNRLILLIQIVALLTWFSIYFLQRNTYESYIEELEKEIERREYSVKLATGKILVDHIHL